MRAVVAGMLAGLALTVSLAGCGNPQTSGIVAIGPDTYAVETRGRSLGTAVERGLTEATSFCTAQSRQTELMGTRINADSYQVAFRCTGGTGLANNPGIIGRMPAGYATRNSSLGPIPVVSGGRPVISGQAFPPPPPPRQGFDMGTVGAMPGRTATVVGNPFAQAPPPPPARLPTSLPPLSSLSSPAGPFAFQAPMASGASVSGASVPPVAPSPFAPLQSPLTAPAAAPAFAPAPVPAFSAPAFAPRAAPAAAPDFAPAASFAPLQSPLAAPSAASPAPVGPAAFQPLFTPSAAPPSGFQPLPGAARPLSALPPVAAPTRSGSSVPPVSSGAPLGEPTGVVPPPAFWNTPR